MPTPNMPGFSLSDAAAALNDAVAADIWYDAPAYGDVEKQRAIDEAHAVMGNVSQWLACVPQTPDGRVVGMQASPQPPLSSSIASPRVLVVVRGGVAETLSDEGIEVEVFDWDDYEDDPEGTGGVSSQFADLARACGAPFDAPIQDGPGSDAKTAALQQLQRALEIATGTGLLDDLADDLHPDVINRFCDAVSDKLKEQSYVFDTPSDTESNPAP